MHPLKNVHVFNLHRSTLQHDNKHNIHPHQGQRNNQNKQKVNHPTPLDTNLKLGFTTTHRKLDHQNKNNNSNNKSKLQATKLRQINNSYSIFFPIQEENPKKIFVK